MTLTLAGVCDTGLHGLYRLAASLPADPLYLSLHGRGDIWALDWQTQRLDRVYQPQRPLLQRLRRRPPRDNARERPLHEVRGLILQPNGPLAIDYGVLPLEGLWWAEDMAAFSIHNKANWKWTMLMVQPDFITPGMVVEAVQAVKRKSNPPLLEQVRFETYHEGLCAQIMHIGPFSAEGPTIERLHRFIADSGRQRRGKHHEIYLSDIRKADPAKWRTVIRQPIR